MADSHGGQWVENRDMERVTVRIPKTQVDSLDRLVETGVHPNRSEAIREGITRELHTHRDVLQDRQRGPRGEQP